MDYPNQTQYHSQLEPEEAPLVLPKWWGRLTAVAGVIIALGVAILLATGAWALFRNGL